MRIPNFKEPGLSKFLSDLQSELKREHTNSVSKVTANHSVLLQSPSDKIYEVTVNDSGVLVVTHVQG